MSVITQTYPVKGMSCASCSAHVDKALRSVAGVAEVNVSLAMNVAKVTYDNAGNHNTHWMVRSFLSQPFGTKKAYLCHATGTEQSAQNLSAACTAHAIAFRSVPDEVVRVAVTVT